MTRDMDGKRGRRRNTGTERRRDRKTMKQIGIEKTERNRKCWGIKENIQDWEAQTDGRKRRLREK